MKACFFCWRGGTAARQASGACYARRQERRARVWGAPAQVDYFISYTSTDVDYHPSKPHGQAIASDRYFTLLADDDGVGFVHCDDGVFVVPLDEGGNVLLALERSVAFDREVLVLAGGTVEPGEPLQQTANRELQEELGWHADQLVFLGELHPFKYLTSRQFVFLARELTPSNRPGDEHHPIGTRTLPLASFTSLCADGELHDAPTIAALHLTQAFIQNESDVKRLR